MTNTVPNVVILRAPGTNCDQETAHAFRVAGTDAVEILHVNRILEKPALLDAAQILCIPGGFSFGDDIAAGRIFASKLVNRLTDELQRFREADKLILGICNGFQVLLKTGLLFGESRTTPATLTWNRSQLYTDRWVHLKTEATDCVFLRGIDEMYLPIAHAEGRFATRSNADLKMLQDQRQLALRYRSDNNPNGSDFDVAGACDATGRIFGLMPHPERHLDALHHPHWTRMATAKSFMRGPASEIPPGDGLAIFQNAVAYFR